MNIPKFGLIARTEVLASEKVIEELRKKFTTPPKDNLAMKMVGDDCLRDELKRWSSKQAISCVADLLGKVFDEKYYDYKALSSRDSTFPEDNSHWEVFVLVTKK